MRSRILKPGFFTNELLAALPFEARLCFAGLWMLADRDGRLEDRPKRIGAALFPYDLIDINKILDQLMAARFINRYTVGAVAVIEIPTFKVHQAPHHRETLSILPCPIISGLSPIQAGPSPESSAPRSSCSDSVSDSVSVSIPVTSARARYPELVERNELSADPIAVLHQRAGDLRQDIYPRLYAKYRHGAKLALFANRMEFDQALTLVTQWDDARLEKLAILVLTTDDPFIAGTDRSFKIFALKATWADDRLAAWEAGQVKTV